ncbi:5-oxoprolinase subunit PxpB [Leifsonia shinshuensis]|uniref:5-oxoprolinase subunit PxpB n=1 Tax=Leifsonia shinshuensis TaxID=150026 RepID=A0A7G6YEX5_9MICO|nr:5-oxoprolinase subunit PxpB [Leifsonia shinshuensis]QNE37040.1 5-oxoprolinase subunit PxpB [Leifsonia shinshuensis]
MTTRVIPYGDSALLVEFGSLDAVLGMLPALQRTRPPGVVDLVPAARTIAVLLDPHVLSPASARGWIERTAPEPAEAADEEVVDIPVRYDGDDLAEVAALLGIAPAEVVERHTASRWRVAFGGFAPGFAYLVTDHDGLVVPRRATPRTSVPAGSVGLAGAFSGVYPRSSPGGWQLIGRTDATLWDAAADPPALLRPGVVVRFTAVTA